MNERYARASNGELIGPYDTAEELERELTAVEEEYSEESLNEWYERLGLRP